MNGISLILIAHNSEKTLEPCLQSVKNLVSEIIFIDDYSTDQTVPIAQKYGAKIFQHQLETCAKQKQYALERASCDWVFLLDSDETVPMELILEINQLFENKDSSAAYRVPRKNIYFGKWLRFGGKYPDYQVRLFKKKCVRFSEHISHEKVIVEGTLGTLNNAIEHFAYPDIETWFLKLKRTAEFDALEWERKGIAISLFNYVRLCILRPFWRFNRKFFLKGGFLDGLPGLMGCLHDLLTQVLTYLILADKNKASQNISPNTKLKA